jgi:HEAT repeat protein
MNSALRALTALASLFVVTAAASLSAAAAAPASQEQLLEVLTSRAPLSQKWVAAYDLARIGTGEAVPKLATLLPDDQLSDLARYAIEAIPDPAVDSALRQALGKLDGRLLAGVITSIGARRDAASVETLSKLLSRPDSAVVSAAVAALGNIGTPPAAKALEAAFVIGQESHFPAVYSAILKCADAQRIHGSRPEAIETYHWIRASKAPPQIQAGAIYGLVLSGETEALQALAAELHSEDTTILGLVQRDLLGPDVTEVLVAELPRLPYPAPDPGGSGSEPARCCRSPGVDSCCPLRRKIRSLGRHPGDDRQPRVCASPERVGGRR